MSNKSLIAGPFAVDFRTKLAIIGELSDVGINISQGPIKRKSSSSIEKAINSTHNSFGVLLHVAVKHQGCTITNLHIPRVLNDLTTYMRTDNLDVEGLFRVPGAVSRMKKLQLLLEEGKPIEGTYHDVAGVLKQYLRCLPDPLLTFTLYPSFVDAYKIKDEEVRLRAILLICLELPISHLHTTMFLMKFFLDVVNNSHNRMSVNGLAAIITPNILRPYEPLTDSKKSSSSHNLSPHAKLTSELEIINHTATVTVVELLITNAHLIGAVPPEIVSRAKEFPSEELAKADYVKYMTGSALPWWKKLLRRSSATDALKRTPSYPPPRRTQSSSLLLRHMSKAQFSPPDSSDTISETQSSHNNNNRSTSSSPTKSTNTSSQKKSKSKENMQVSSQHNQLPLNSASSLPPTFPNSFKKKGLFGKSKSLDHDSSSSFDAYDDEGQYIPDEDGERGGGGDGDEASFNSSKHMPSEPAEKEPPPPPPGFDSFMMY